MQEDTFKDEVRELLSILERGAKTGEIRRAVASVYAPDVVAAGQDAPTTFDSPTLGAVWADLMRTGANLRLTLLDGGVRITGEVAFTFVENAVEPLDGSPPFTGKSLLVWQRQRGGGWRCIADMCAMGAY